MKRILLVEDDEIISSGLVYAFEQEGYEIVSCGNVKQAYDATDKMSFDLAILDMQLPDGNGFDVRDRLKDRKTAVIFLTVVDDEGKVVRAFDEGAADYVTKPFRLRELLARVKRTLNAGENGKNANLLTIGSTVIDQDSGRVSAGGSEVELTALEYRLLLIFVNNKGRILTRNQILENIWDCGGNFVEDNTLTVYVKRLRKKLGDSIKIETVRGTGYRAD